jgi:hypothetical protein
VGTGWWGNEFAWQGGCASANILGIGDLDAVVEYTRIEPYVYSNRVAGNDYTHDNIGLGHHLQPNSDELFARLTWRPDAKVMVAGGVTFSRHGENITADTGLVRNVGGDVLAGHRGTDSETATFLDGHVVRLTVFQTRASWEPVSGLLLLGVFELRHESDDAGITTGNDRYASLRIQIDY